MSKPRNYQAEYERRIARALSLGHSRSQARGHAKAGEKPMRSQTARSPPDDRLELALRLLRKSGNQGLAAKEARVSRERFRRFLGENDIAKRQGRKWVFSDSRPREMSIITMNGPHLVKVAGFETASLIGKHSAAVGKFIETNDASLLKPFEGVSITDTSDKAHFLETRPNHLYRLAASGSDTFEMVYRLIA